MCKIEKAAKTLKTWMNCPFRFGGNCQNEDNCPNTDNCWTRARVIKAVNMAIQALQEKLEREAEPTPLTLDELRKREGKPVWVEDLLIPKCSSWHFVVKHNNELRLFDKHAIAQKVVGCNATTGHNYGKTWLCYDREPRKEG